MVQHASIEQYQLTRVCPSRRTAARSSFCLLYVHHQVAVCRRCYEVYRRLDKLRESTDHTAGKTEDRESSPLSSLPLPFSSKGQGLLASVDATVASGRRAAAVGAGALALREEVAEMLKDVDARAGKLGNEAGIVWRRRLRYVHGAIYCHRFNTKTKRSLSCFICCRLSLSFVIPVAVFFVSYLGCWYRCIGVVVAIDIGGGGCCPLGATIAVAQSLRSHVCFTVDGLPVPP